MSARRQSADGNFAAKGEEIGRSIDAGGAAFAIDEIAADGVA
jgi:hypothetical protein